MLDTATCIWIHVVNSVGWAAKLKPVARLKMKEIVAAGVSAAFIIIKRKKKMMIEEFLKNETNHDDNLMSELLLNDGSSFRNIVRVTKANFGRILCLVAPKICKNNTNYREVILLHVLTTMLRVHTERCFPSETGIQATISTRCQHLLTGLYVPLELLKLFQLYVPPSI